MHASGLPPGWTEKLGGHRPTVAVVLGSGLAPALDGFEVLIRTPYAEIPDLPLSSVTGHHGELLLLRVDDRLLIGVSGRVHLYEGQGASQATSYVRYLHKIGCKSLIITNAAGSCSPGSGVGEWMQIQDQINLTGASPLEGASFVDMTDCYDPVLRTIFQSAAGRLGIPLHSGVYLAVRGPQYETPAEVRAFRLLGADAIGMSTVLEVIQARALGMRVAGFSCLTNQAAGTDGGTPLSHQEVLDTGRAAAGHFARLLREALPDIPA